MKYRYVIANKDVLGRITGIDGRYITVDDKIQGPIKVAKNSTNRFQLLAWWEYALLRIAFTIKKWIVK